MAALNAIDVPMSDVTRNMTIQLTVSGLRTFKVRLWLCCQIIRFGAWVGGFGFIVEDGDENTISMNSNDE